MKRITAIGKLWQEALLCPPPKASAIIRVDCPPGPEWPHLPVGAKMSPTAARRGPGNALSANRHDLRWPFGAQSGAERPRLMQSRVRWGETACFWARIVTPQKPPPFKMRGTPLRDVCPGYSGHAACTVMQPHRQKLTRPDVVGSEQVLTRPSPTVVLIACMDGAIHELARQCAILHIAIPRPETICPAQWRLDASKGGKFRALSVGNEGLLMWASSHAGSTG